MSKDVQCLLDTSRGGPLSPAAMHSLTLCGSAGWSDPSGASSQSRRASDLLSAAHDSLASRLAPITPATVLIRPGGGHALADGLAGLLAGVSTPEATATLVVTAIDHSATLRVARWWRSQGHPTITVGVDALGHIDAAALLEAALGSGPTVVCLQLANGEVGTLQDVEPILEQLSTAGVPTLLDATASAGRISIPGGWSVLAADAVSWGGPRGTGVLMVAAGSPWRLSEPAIANEQPVALIVAAASALEAAEAERAVESDRAWGQIARIRDHVQRHVADVVVAGDPDRRLPHALTLSALYVGGESLVRTLDERGVSVGSGSACASDSGEPSHVLAAMGVLTGGNVRLCLPLGCPDDAIELFLTQFPPALAALRQAEPVATVGGGVAPPHPTVQDGAMDDWAEPQAWYDERGNRCPAPVIALARAVFARPPGTVVAVMASDPAAETDIPAWCRLRGAEYLGTRPPRDGGEGLAYLVRTPLE
ncbi:MAG: aminotransferase class V-fold PLP-dependent enzyme [Actinobacteria bacterium]|nr:aminotransferase class V-fold PLP-dependent enzyme [Actinomycetota bacterium]